MTNPDAFSAAADSPEAEHDMRMERARALVDSSRLSELPMDFDAVVERSISSFVNADKLRFDKIYAGHSVWLG